MIGSQLETQFRNLSRREQRILVILSPLMIALAVWLLLIDPLQTEHFQHQQALEKKQLELSWMQAASKRVAALRKKETSGKQPALDTLCRQLLREVKIKADTIQALNPNQLTIRAYEASYAATLLLLEHLERNHIQLDEVDISANSKPGRITLALKLSRQELE